MVQAWMAAAGATLGMAGFGELYGRVRGFSPSVADDWWVWARLRRLANSGRRVIALVGASRLQLGVEPVTLARLTGLRTVMLAIDGASPLPVLRDLAQDRNFRGSVICSYVPQLFAETAPPDTRALKWIRKYRQQNRVSRLVAYLWTGVQAEVGLCQPALKPIRIWEHLKGGRRLKRPHAPMRRDRYRGANYERIDLTRLRRARLEIEHRRSLQARPLARDAYQQRVARIAGWLRKIQERGGRVAWVRLPSSGEIRFLEQATWPREIYWQSLVAGCRVPAVHFEDDPDLSNLKCPDDSHLAASDARHFTAKLVDILGKEGFFVPSHV